MDNKKIQIAICEPNERHRSEIVHALNQILFAEYEYQIAVCSCPVDLIRSVQGNIDRYDIILTEMDFPESTGLQMAKFLRSKGCKSAIVFLTTNRGMSLGGYKVQAFDYLIKPVALSGLAECFVRFASESFEQEKSYQYKVKRGMHSIHLKNVCYFISTGRKINVVTTEKQESFYGKLNDVAIYLSEKQFIRPHQSYLVNLDYVSSFSRNQITMHDGTIIPISRQRSKEAEVFLRQHFDAAANG